jgi:hypothetical protein
VKSNSLIFLKLPIATIWFFEYFCFEQSILTEKLNYIMIFSKTNIAAAVFLMSIVVVSCGPSVQDRQAIENNISTLQQNLIEYDGQLTVLYDRKKHDAQFHLLRTSAERESTLKNDQEQIDILKIKINNTKNDISNMQAKLR